MKKDVGAGGDWKRIGEKKDSRIVKQFNENACVAAVGEMLLRKRGRIISQSEIGKSIGTPANFEELANFLNSLPKTSKVWIGGFFDVRFFERIVDTGTWGAVLREPTFRGHAVLVEGLTKQGFVKIKDPFDQTSYRMSESEFLKYLSEFICEKPEV